MQHKVVAPLPRWTYGVASVFWATLIGSYVVVIIDTQNSNIWTQIAIVLSGLWFAICVRAFVNHPRREREYQESLANDQKENGR